jgi:hypothetical protein
LKLRPLKFQCSKLEVPKLEQLKFKIPKVELLKPSKVTIFSYKKDDGLSSTKHL